MATIYIPVEVPDDEIKRLLEYRSIIPVLAETPVPTQPGQQFARTPSEFGYTVAPAQPQGDPWGTSATPAAPPAAPLQSAPTPAAGGANYTPPGVPLCDHGLPMKRVEAGFSKTKNKSYPAFWACPMARGQQCSKRVDG